MNDQSGRVINGYKLLAPLGEGAMGWVWQAQEMLSGREVALKIMRLVAEDPHSIVQRSFREAQLTNKLVHPGIVSVYEWFQDSEGRPCIVMELIEGVDLQRHVKSSGPLKQMHLARLAMRLAEALSVLHAAGIVHRDLKPSNVLIGAEGLVKIVDFGIAYHAGNTRLTQVGTTLGTPSYMAPEYISGAKATPKVDMWALGATLYFAATGRVPFTGENVPQVICAVRENPPEAHGLEGPLAEIIDGCLCKDPDERWTTSDVLRLLTEFQTAVAPPSGTDPTNAVTLSDIRREAALWRRRLFYAEVAALLLMVVIAATFALARATQDKQSTGNEPASGSPSPTTTYSTTSPRLSTPEHLQPAERSTSTPVAGSSKYSQYSDGTFSIVVPKYLEPVGYSDKGVMYFADDCASLTVREMDLAAFGVLNIEQLANLERIKDQKNGAESQTESKLGPNTVSWEFVWPASGNTVPVGYQTNRTSSSKDCPFSQHVITQIRKLPDGSVFRISRIVPLWYFGLRVNWSVIREEFHRTTTSLAIR